MDEASKKILKYIATLEKMKDDIRELKNKKIRGWDDMSEKAEKESKILDEIYTEKIDHLYGAQEDIDGAIRHLYHLKPIEE